MKTMKLTGFALTIALTAGLIGCSDDDNNSNNTLPPIGGYNAAGEVASAELLAYWPLDGNGTESKSGVNPSASVAATWEAGAKGQGVTFNEGYLKYPVIPALNTSLTGGSFTVSCWAKVANNGTNATMIFSMTRPASATTSAWDGNMNILAETGIGTRLVSSDTLKVKGLFAFEKPDGTIFGGDAVNAETLTEEDIANGGVPVVNKTANQWMQVVYTYDAATAINKLYVNGVKISNPQWESRNQGTGVPFKADAASHPLIGSFGSVINGTPDGWQKSMIGSVDEIRIWKKVLQPSDINSLYLLEKSGR